MNSALRLLSTFILATAVVGKLEKVHTVQKHGGLMRAEEQRTRFKMRTPPARKYGTEITPALIEMYSSQKHTNGNDPNQGIDFLCEDPTAAHTMCKLLDGTNAQVTDNLEKAVQGVNIEDDATANVAQIENDEGGQLATFRNSLWTLYFCSKQINPTCDPATSEDPEVMNARVSAERALTAIQSDDATAQDTAKT